MTDRLWSRCLLMGLLFISATGCGHRQGTVVAVQTAKPIPLQPKMLTVAPAPPVPVQTFHSTPPAIQFDYPGDWHPSKTSTGVFAITGPEDASLALDIPKLPWHIPGMIPIGMVASGYVDDLRKGLIPDAVVQEQISLKVGDAPARRITCAGHAKGKPAFDMAVIMIHADHVYILSADSGDTGRAVARQTLDDAVASLKWIK